ncbi:PEP-CTERM sorting domain-containing protein [Albimonas pacifica]|uniref:VPLPA-CTERM protein sorting domain-containing protein n=1 Tax=Albimonas pacifica TaxID=1114924 RepID=A0A1I3J353_9RHOB|nr:PEP-CTERM sorting domain-containing protein [Albimonas pacifica]SFI54684.1 hypothetical protein SAMN05216258_107343 [Albimonas pacifica]
MKPSVLAPLALAAGLALSPVAAQATIVFNFEWSGAADALGVVSTQDPTLTGSGWIELDVAAGETFNQSDVVDMLLSFSGVEITPFIIDAGDSLTFGGQVAASGATATLFDFPAPAMISGSNFFGCAESGCGSTLFNILVSDGVNDLLVGYGSSVAAAGSIQLTAVGAAVPLPATLPLAVAGLGALAWASRRRAG